MSIYVDRDLASTFEGEIELDQKGDIKLANALETYKSAANFILRCDNGDYQPNPRLGSNLGTFIGSRNIRETHSLMEHSIVSCLVGNLFSDTDVSADVVPLDIEESVCFITLAGMYLIDGDLVAVHDERLVYSFPYIDGEPTPLTI